MQPMVNPLAEFIFSVVAALAFAGLFNAPKKTMAFSSVTGGIGWLIFRYMGEGLAAYFVAALVMAVLGEILARIMKMPATIFIHVSVIPLVPGLGLYRTMLYLVNGEYMQGLMQGANTLLGMGCIAMAVGVSTLLFKYFQPRKRKTSP